MVNEKRLKAMIRLAEYEKNGSGELRICRYSRRDYLILSLIRTYFLTTIGFGLLLLLAAIGNMTTVMDQINYIDIRALIAWVFLGYLAFLLFYMVLTFVHAWRRYRRASCSIQGYERELTRLDRLYRREDS